ncbi:hypothetical protein UPYG_G00043640 [Umbra pygmaea]|uniref:Fibronectin type-III domain-containing protein n=1 Tax=Umbra pygmaea TaxID=75934 RepID=A0ABD0XQJ3_UMBPY
MIGRVLEQSKALSQVLFEDKKTRHLVPTWQDTDVLESINNALGPLQEFTDALSGEAYVSVSYLKPVLHLLRTSTLTESDEDTNLTKEIKTSALGYIEDKYSDPATQELMDINSFLDPRFKTDYISAETVPDIKERVKIEMEQEKRAHVSTTDPMPQGAAEAEPSTTGKGKRSLSSFFKSKAVPPSSSTTQLEDAIKAELDNYLMTPTIDGEQDPLAWWRVHNDNFPWLSKLAQPLAPDQLTVDSVDTTSATVIWNQPPGLDQTHHQYKISYCCPGTERHITTTSSASITLSDLKPATEYSVTVCTVLENGMESQMVLTTINTMLPAPDQLTVDSVDATSATVIWNQPPGLDNHHYQISYQCPGTEPHITTSSPSITLSI